MAKVNPRVSKKEVKANNLKDSNPAVKHKTHRAHRANLKVSHHKDHKTNLKANNQEVKDKDPRVANLKVVNNLRVSNQAANNLRVELLKANLRVETRVEINSKDLVLKVDQARVDSPKDNNLSKNRNSKTLNNQQPQLDRLNPVN